MTIIAILTLLFVVGILLERSYEFEIIGLILAALSGVCLFAAIVTIAAIRIDCADKIIRLEERRKVQEQGRESGHPLEGAAWRAEITEANEWLASAQYWNRTIFDIWIPDSVESVKPIKP